MGNNIRIKTCKRSFLINNDMYDYTDENNYCFESGKSYALIGDFGHGGDSISGLLTNRVNIVNEVIEVDSTLDRSYPQREGWRVGQTCYSKITGREIDLKLLLRESESLKCYSDVVDFFEINPNNLPRRISEMPHEKWRVSIAIGLLKRKQLFGFPFMNSRFLFDVLYSSGNALSIKKITEYGGIVIIPTNDIELITPIVDEVVFINNGRFNNLESYAIEQMKRMKLLD